MSLKRRPTHQGLYLSEHVVKDADKPRLYVTDPGDAAIFTKHIRLFVSQWLPKILHYKPTRALVMMSTEVRSFDHISPTVVDGKPVRLVAFNLTKKRS